MNRRTKLVGIAVIATAIAVVFYIFDPAQLSFLPRCPLHTLTGLYCPGCGSTRAMHQLAQGHLAVAFGLNPLAVCALPLLGYFALRGRAIMIRPFWIWMLVGMICAFGILRNIPAYPFTLLAP